MKLDLYSSDVNGVLLSSKHSKFIEGLLQLSTINIVGYLKLI